MINFVGFLILIFTYFIFIPIIIHFEIKLNPNLFYALHYKDIERGLKRYEKGHKTDN